MTAVDWRPLAGALVDTLAAGGVLPEPAWRQAFAETPRHLFVPSFLERSGGTEQVVDGGDAAARDHWLAQVYSDTNLITQIKPSGPQGGRRPTSSSSMPSIMAWMLTPSTYRTVSACWRSGPAPVTTPPYCATGWVRPTW